MAADGEGTEATRGSLRKVITVRHAVAIYVSSVLGAGILVIPGLAAKAAGPGSLVASSFLSLASYPFAYTFSRLSARRPESGGIYSFAKEAFGHGMSSMTAWLFVAWVALGAPAITLAAGTYLAYAFPISGPEVFLVAAAILALAYGINLRGIRFSGRVQVAAVTIMVSILALGVAASSPNVRASNFTPFLPDGFAAIGVASALIVWSYLGYENVSNIAEEFKDPRRDFGRSVTISVLLISALYMAVAITVVGTGSYTAGGGVTPFAELMTSVFGSYGGAVVSVFAVVIIFSTVNAYTAGMGRVVYAAAIDGNLPRFLARIDPKTGVPRRALLALLALVLADLVFYYLSGFDLESAFLATSGAAVMTYVVGSAAGIRLLKGRGASRALPWVSLLISLALIPFIGPLLLASVPVAGLGFAYGFFRRLRGPGSPPERLPPLSVLVGPRKSSFPALSQPPQGIGPALLSKRAGAREPHAFEEAWGSGPEQRCGAPPLDRIRLHRFRLPLHGFQRLLDREPGDAGAPVSRGNEKAGYPPGVLGRRNVQPLPVDPWKLLPGAELAPADGVLPAIDQGPMCPSLHGQCPLCGLVLVVLPVVEAPGPVIVHAPAPSPDPSVGGEEAIEVGPSLRGKVL